MVKTGSWIGILLIGFFVSCENYDFSKMSGMWQLKTIVDGAGNRQAVDTVYYSFQNDAFFSYTVVNTKTDKVGAETLLFGYVDLPAKNKLHITMDAQYNYPDALNLLPWKALDVRYDIVTLNRKELVLKQNDTMYYFIKF